jgi:hypothetical protein
MLWLRSAPWGGYAGRPPDLVPAHTNPGHSPPVDEYHGGLNPALFQISIAGIERSGGMHRHLPTQGWAGREYHIRHINHV